MRNLIVFDGNLGFHFGCVSLFFVLFRVLLRGVLIVLAVFPNWLYFLVTFFLSVLFLVEFCYCISVFHYLRVSLYQFKFKRLE